jgi:hypothetical protein
MKRAVGSLLSAIGLLVVGLAMFVGVAGPASAAGTGYAPPPLPPPVVPSSVCGSGTVVTSANVGAAGGSITGTVGASTVTVTVPAGALPSTGTQVSLNTPSVITVPNGTSLVLAFAVNFCVNGTKFTGTFATPVTVTVSLPAIKPGQSLFEQTAGGLVPVTPSSITNGSFSVTITGDPSFVLVTAATSTLIPGATSVVTGKPFLLEGLVGGAMLLLGSLLLLRLRFRHH